MNTSELEGFITRYWPGNETRWFRALADHQLVGIDWQPDPWSRDNQLQFVDALCRYRCPVMPESISIVAPVCQAAGSEELWHKVAALIREDPASDALSFSLDEDTFVLGVAGETHQIGSPGAAPHLLAHHFSPLCCLHEVMLGVALCRDTLSHWRDMPDTALCEIEVKVDSVKALFVSNTRTADRQIALMTDELRLESYWLLNGYLGYYSLLEPDPSITGNEPIPFEPQRNYLRYLRVATDRDERIQRDELFEEISDEQT